VSRKKEGAYDMPTALHIASRLHVTPLLNIHHPPFEKLYQNGVYWSLFRERHTRPMTDSYMLKNVRESLTDTDVDGQQGFWLPIIGFHFGRLHGAILSSQTGNPRPDVTALAHDAAYFHDGESTWYYAIGCMLGELSGQLFPATTEEYARWEADRRFWQAHSQRTSHHAADTEPVSIVTTIP